LAGYSSSDYDEDFDDLSENEDSQEDSDDDNSEEDSDDKDLYSTNNDKDFSRGSNADYLEALYDPENDGYQPDYSSSSKENDFQPDWSIQPDRNAGKRYNKAVANYYSAVSDYYDTQEELYKINKEVDEINKRLNKALEEERINNQNERDSLSNYADKQYDVSEKYLEASKLYGNAYRSCLDSCEDSKQCKPYKRKADETYDQYEYYDRAGLRALGKVQNLDRLTDYRLDMRSKAEREADNVKYDYNDKSEKEKTTEKPSSSTVDKDEYLKDEEKQDSSSTKETTSSTTVPDYCMGRDDIDWGYDDYSKKIEDSSKISKVDVIETSFDFEKVTKQTDEKESSPDESNAQAKLQEEEKAIERDLDELNEYEYDLDTEALDEPFKTKATPPTDKDTASNPLSNNETSSINETGINKTDINETANETSTDDKVDDQKVNISDSANTTADIEPAVSSDNKTTTEESTQPIPDEVNETVNETVSTDQSESSQKETPQVTPEPVKTETIKATDDLVKHSPSPTPDPSSRIRNMFIGYLAGVVGFGKIINWWNNRNKEITPVEHNEVAGEAGPRDGTEKKEEAGPGDTTEEKTDGDEPPAAPPDGDEPPAVRPPPPPLLPGARSDGRALTDAVALTLDDDGDEPGDIRYPATAEGLVRQNLAMDLATPLTRVHLNRLRRTMDGPLMRGDPDRDRILAAIDTVESTLPPVGSAEGASEAAAGLGVLGAPGPDARADAGPEPDAAPPAAAGPDAGVDAGPAAPAVPPLPTVEDLTGADIGRYNAFLAGLHRPIIQRTMFGTPEEAQRRFTLMLQRWNDPGHLVAFMEMAEELGIPLVDTRLGDPEAGEPPAGDDDLTRTRGPGDLRATDITPPDWNNHPRDANPFDLTYRVPGHTRDEGVTTVVEGGFIFMGWPPDNEMGWPVDNEIDQRDPRVIREVPFMQTFIDDYLTNHRPEEFTTRAIVNRAQGMINQGNSPFLILAYLVAARDTMRRI
jgi:hypothetical protein